MTETECCPACESTEASVLFQATDRLYGTTNREFEIVECGRCRLMRLSPTPTPRELGSYYPPSYWFSAGESTAARAEELYRRIVLHDHTSFILSALRRCGEEGPLLDVGCGGGLILRLLRDKGVDGVGLDFSHDAAAVATNVNGVPVTCGTLSRPPFAAETFAVVTMFHVLEHLYDPVKYLDMAHKLLKPEGRLIVQVPNAACWQMILFGENWNGIDAPRHLFHFREKDLVTLLENCGYEVVRRKHFSLRDNPAGFATSLAPGLDPMSRRVRSVKETHREKLFKDLLYFGLVIAALPFTLVEAASRAGSTIMIEARKKQ